MSTFNELIDFTRSTTGTYLDSVVYGDDKANAFAGSGGPTWTVVDKNTVSGTQPTNLAYFTGIVSGLTIGAQYKLELTITNYAGSNDFGMGSAGGVGSLVRLFGNGTMTSFFTATAVSLDAFMRDTNSGTISVSVKEVIGGQVSGTPLLRTAAINEPRLEYDASGNPLGLLIEEARTNIIATSEALVVSSNRATAESSISPTEEQTAQTWRVNGSASATPYMYQTPNIISGTTYTCSVFVRLPTSGPTVELRYIKLSSQSTIQVGATIFDLQEGTVVSSNMLSESITPVGNGWYRISVTNIGQTPGNNFSFILWPCINAAGSLYVISASDDGKALFETFGMQTEAGSFPTSYIPTSGSTVTRAADFATVPIERFAYNDRAATYLITAVNPVDVTAQQQFLLGTQSGNARIAYSNNGDSYLYSYSGSNTPTTNYFNNGIYAGTGLYGTIKVNETQKFALKLKATASGGFLLSKPTELWLGRSHGNTGFWNGHIKHIQYYPKGLSNEELQLLTQPSASPTMNLTFDGQATSTLVEGLHD